MDEHGEADDRIYLQFFFPNVKKKKNRSPCITCLTTTSEVPSSRCFQLLLSMLVISEADCIPAGGADETPAEPSVTWIGSDVTKKVPNTSCVGTVAYGHNSGQLGTPAPAITTQARTQTTSDPRPLQFTKDAMCRRLKCGDRGNDAGSCKSVNFLPLF